MTGAGLPKAELHCHIEGAMPAALTRRIAARNGVALPANLIDSADAYAWHNFNSFLDAYDIAAGALRTAADYAELVHGYLAGCARQGAIYVEVFNSPDHARTIGLPYAEQIAGLAEGIDRAEREHGIVGRIVSICLRHLGPDRALEIARLVRDEPHPYVVGFGMAGNEARFEAREFAPAFGVMDAAGYPCTAHAGEVVGPEGVRATLAALPVCRLGHGVRAAEDPALVRQIAKSGITLEVCPGSNIALGLYRDRRHHPLPTLIEAGCRVTLNSDDPAFFGTSIGQEYDKASDELGLSEEQLLAFTRTALEAAFAGAGTMQRLRARLADAALHRTGESGT